MATPETKPKKSELLRRVMEFIFGFENKRGEILDSWIFPVHGFNGSSEEFYAIVEQELVVHKIPSLQISRQSFAEGGLLSEQRIYLRLMRERLAIVTCAAPFGNLFFFSCRTVYVPALVRLWHIWAVNVFLSLVFYLLVKPLGFSLAMSALITLPFALAGVLRNASTAGFSDLDTILLRIPVVSTIYQDWFRQETYYREDTRSLYIKILPDLIREAAEKLCAAKGVKLDTQLQSPPPVNDLLPTKKSPAP